MSGRLIQLVENLLTSNNLDISAMSAHPIITDVAHLNDFDKHRSALNRFWNLQLISLPVDTITERYCLVSNGTKEDWIRLFSTKILPKCVEHKLPKYL